jgi:hypothetical protein
MADGLFADSGKLNEFHCIDAPLIRDTSFALSCSHPPMRTAMEVSRCAPI